MNNQITDDKEQYFNYERNIKKIKDELYDKKEEYKGTLTELDEK